MTVQEAIVLLTETIFKDWPIKGPRTVLWIMKELRRQNMTPLQRHTWWKSVLKLLPDNFGVAEHEAICRALELAF